jgi:hypothetical protein
MRPRRVWGGPPGPGELRPHDPACRYFSMVAVTAGSLCEVVALDRYQGQWAGPLLGR